MRRLFPVLLLMLAACSPHAAKPPAERLLYAGEGRDRLCLAGERGGIIVYGKGDANCTARGRVDRRGEHLLTIIAGGDQDCRIDLHEQSGSIRLGNMAAGCAYYCGPGANYAGKAFAKNASASPAVDFAGDPLC
jgi:hypothetical protein